MEIFFFAELVSSNDFFVLFQRSLSLFNDFIGLGVYQQGFPIRPTVDFVWGTNSGIRTLPILFFLFLLQKIFPIYWDSLYLGIAFALPFVTFLIALAILKKIHVFTLLGALFYGGNVWIINRIFSGFWQLNIVYAFLPFLVTIPIKVLCLNKYTIHVLAFWASLYALLASVVLIAQPHFLIIIGIFTLLFMTSLLVIKNKHALIRLLTFYSFTVLIFFFLNAYIFLPSLLYPEITFTAADQYFSLASVTFNGQGAQIENILRMNPLFPYKPFTWQLREYIQLIPILSVFIFFFLNRNRKWIYAVCLLIFIFLAKGLNEPVDTISKWLYQNIFFLHYFRDPSRFLAGVGLFSSLIIADFHIKQRLNKAITFLLVIIFVVLFIKANEKSLIETKPDILQKTKIPAEYLTLQQFINTNIENTTYRLLTLPNTQGMQGYSWYKNPIPATSNTVFDVLIPLRIPLANGSSYPDNYSNQVSAFFYQKYSESYIPEYLNPLVVKYILTDTSVTFPQDAKDIATKSATFGIKNGKRIFYEKNLSLYEIDNNTSLVTYQKPLFAIGNLNTLQKIYRTGSTRPVILLNQSINREIKSLEYLQNEDLFIDINNPVLTFTGERLSNKYQLDILESGWNYDKIFVNFEPYKMKYIMYNGQLFTSGKAVVSSQQMTGSMEIRERIDSGKYRLLIKALSEIPVEITIKIGERNKTIQINSQASLLWNDLGTINLTAPQDQIVLEKKDKNPLIIDYLLVIPESAYQKEYKNIENLIGSMKKIEDIKRTTSNNNFFSLRGKDNIRSEKPIKYFTYRFTYGEQWKSDKPSVKFVSDGYGMTFIAKKNKISEIIYFPNKIYTISLVISLLSLLTIILYVSAMSIKYRNKE